MTFFQLSRRMAPRKGSGGQTFTWMAPLPRATALGVLLATILLTPSLSMAQSATLVLKDNVSTADGRITIGDLFDNAGDASDVVLGTRTGATTILDAAIVQTIAARNGAMWDNPRGLRRIMVTSSGDSAPADATSAVMASPDATPGAAPAGNISVLTFVHAMNSGDIVQPEDLTYTRVAATSGNVPNDVQAVIGKTVRFPIREGAIIHTTDLTSPTVVRRSETVSVTWTQDGLSLTMSGLAQKDAAVGDLIQVQNPASKKLVDTVITGPGQGVAGQAADEMRSRQFLSSR